LLPTDQFNHKNMEVHMSSPTVSPSQVPAQPTRRQLDELDALLQRMLELPVHQTESEMEATISQAPQIANPVFSEREEEVEHRWETFQPAMKSFAVSVTPVESAAYSQMHDDVRLPEEIGKPFATLNVQTDPPHYFTETQTESDPLEKQPLKSPALADEERKAWVPNALLWIDDLYVSMTATWGSLGYWLRGPAGRTFLGGLGLAALAVALALTVRDRINWPL
jgi:hypothetical protein